MHSVISLAVLLGIPDFPVEPCSGCCKHPFGLLVSGLGHIPKLIWSLCAGVVIAEGQDGTHQHPVSHAILVAVEAAAARDRRLWPTSSSQSQDCGMASARDAPPLSLQATAIDALDHFATESPGLILTVPS